jgi:hypothetical protein
MNFINTTKMQAGYVVGLGTDAREQVVVVVKGTFAIPPAGRAPELAAEQAPLVYADVFTGEPGFSSTLYECDFAAFKPRCDVLLNGSAYAPHGRAVKKLAVGLEVGGFKKSFAVVGDRVWKKRFFRVRASSPKAFKVMPISYDNAFGGVDNLDKNPRRHETCLANFAGKGFYPRSKSRRIAGKSAPNTEELGKPVKKPDGSYRPMAFGTIGRAWIPRREFAGTYDQKWIDRVFPFYPDDFDPRYNQAAPPEQQIDYLRGGEDVRLFNLMPQSRVTFRLPRIEMPVVFTRKNGEETEVSAVNDTLLIEPDLKRFILVWRAALPIYRNIFEMKTVMAGRMPRAYYRARQTGKRYFSSLEEFIRARARERQAMHEKESQEAADMHVLEEMLEAEKIVEEEVDV